MSEETTKKLERTLDLKAALAIGVGTMVGAGIFVFPGIAAGHAGPAAIISFALGGIIALLVAVSTAELATAMPESGGAYYFVSRTFGPLPGFLVGVGQCIGLIFASAFYLTGFAQYAIELLTEAGIDLGRPVILIALLTAIALSVINLLGTKGVGNLQNQIVIALTAILTLLFGYGVLNAVGVVGESEWPVPFAPKGIWPIFTTTALIFTSYLGFVQVATVAGEIKNPSRNLPRALVGSVLLVMGLYIVAIFVSTTTLSTARLAELGETAMIDVARSLVGRVGALGILGAGLLATLSSANASILSSSRAIYALGYDDMIPEQISAVNDRFGTPHYALIIVGGTIAGLTLLGRIEILAEVASLLHLVMYGMICLTLLVVRKEAPLWYVPSFRAPAVPFIPAVGALACFGLIFFMENLSVVLGFIVIFLALVWYSLFVPRKKFAPPEPPVIEPELLKPRILVPIQLPDPAPLPVALINAFRDLELMILGYNEVPEQTSPVQSREEFEEKAAGDLGQITDQLKARDIDIEEELIFTPDVAKSVGQYIKDKHCSAILAAKPIQNVKRLLVPLYSKEQITPRLATILSDLVHSNKLPVSLILLTSREKESEKHEDVHALRQEAIVQLNSAGISNEQIRVNKAQVPDIAKAVQKLSAEDDVIILPEADPQKRDSLLDTVHDEIQKAVSCPVLVVLKKLEKEEHKG